MRKMIIKVNGRRESATIQHILFKKGVYWVTGIKHVQECGRKYLFVDKLNSKNFAISWRDAVQIPEEIEFKDCHEHLQLSYDEFLNLHQ